MTINSVNTNLSGQFLTSIGNSQSSSQQARPSGPPPGGGAKPPSSDEMKQMIAKLKETDPALAAKLEKVSSKMEELKKSGVSQEEAMKTIQSEFGKPTDTEMKEIGSVMQQLQTGHQVDTNA